MGLADEIEIRIAGNLCSPVTLERGGAIAVAEAAAAPVALVGGRLERTTIRLMLEVHGAANAAAFAARAGRGSRVILRGTLERRAESGALVVVVERLLHVAPPAPEGYR